MSSLSDQEEFLRLFRLSLVPLYTVLPALVWVLHDYFVTLEDEILYIWSQKPSAGRLMYFFIRYYTILLLVFDVTQIHLFAVRGIPNRNLCVTVDPVVRLVGAISLWMVEVIMQLRIYALYNCSKKVAIFNGTLFAISIAAFIWIMIHNANQRAAAITSALRFPLPGCPTINAGTSQWALWVPATIFELVLFVFALFKSAVSTSARVKLNGRVTLTAFLIHDNMLYFIGVSALLIFNNLMVVRATMIPWFGFGPFHAAIGIMTTRMMIHLQKFALHELEGGSVAPMSSDMTYLPPPVFAERSSDDTVVLRETIIANSNYDIENMAGSSLHVITRAGPSRIQVDTAP
ncbi:hypothetical protein B0H34DRAFT_801819 [Crassisporium funariophilum]|nr:hypothetical protein B0H34DRAFT_801819 [Crassisporium funariophilum]